MTRLRWMLLLTLSILLILLFFGTPLYGRQLLSRIPGDTSVSADTVSGPLWRPTLRGVRVEGPGLSGRADEVTLGLRDLDFGGRQARVTGRVRGAVVNVDLEKILSQPVQDGWRVWPEDLDVQNVRVNVDSGGLALPNARLTVSGRNGALDVRATSKNGTADATARYAVENGDLAATADLRVDATLLRQYWDGVRGGEFRGRYTLRGGDLRGDLTLAGGVVTVPEAPFVTVRGIRGDLRQRGDRFDATLTGAGLGGPVTLQAAADLARERWNLTARATPKVSNLARALGVEGSGALDLRATAGGWDRPRVDVRVRGATGEVAGVPFRDLVGSYRLSEEGASVVTARADTRLLNESQRVDATWTLGRTGRATVVGRLLGEPLNVTATLDGDDVSATGSALAGTLRAAYDVKSGATSARVNVRPSGVAVRASASGTPSDLRLRFDELAAGPVALSGTGRYDARGLSLDLGAVRATLDPRGRGTWAVSNFDLSGVGLSGSGRFDATRQTLAGTLAANVPLVEAPLTGAIDLNVSERRGAWNFGRGAASWRGETLALALRDLVVAGYETRGNVTYRDGDVRGTVRASGQDANVVLRGLGSVAALDGNVRGVQVRGRTNLTRDFSTTLALTGSDVRANVSFTDGVRFDVTSGRETLRGTLGDGQLSADGAVDLAALRSLVGVPDLTGRADLAFKDGRGTATLAGSALGATLRASATGTLDDIRLRVDRLAYEGFALAGTGRYDRRGLALDLGALRATLDPEGRGTWTASKFEASGVELSGSGRFDVGARRLGGTLSARVPLVDEVLAGPIDADLARSRASWNFGRGLASWRGDEVALSLRGLNVAGYDTRGDVTYRDGGLFGEARATGDDLEVVVKGLGQRATLEGSVRGVRLVGSTNLKNFATTVRAVEADVRANVSFTDGVRFDVTSGRETLRGTLDDGQLSADGAVDLAALRSLVGVPDLTGRADLAFENGRGTATLAGSALGATLRGTVTGTTDRVTARLGGEYAGATFDVAGRVYPDVNVRGPVSWQGQTVTASVSGAFDALRFDAAGRTGPIEVAGVRLPAQALRATGTLTPALAASGRFGNLTFTSDGRTVRASGTQIFEALGERGQLRVDGTFGPKFAGRLAASASIGEFTLAANGPWRDLAVTGRGRGFTADGRLNAETLTYDARVRGRLDAYFVNATLSGRAADVRARGELFDEGGGSARFEATSLESWQARVSSLTVGGERVNGALSASAGLVSGELSAAGLRVRADRGRLTLSGAAAGARVDGTATVRLPADVRDIALTASSTWGTAEVRGDLDALRGRVRVNGQGVEQGGVRADVPSFTLPLTLFPARLEARVGGLTYANGAFGGAQAVPYRLGGDRGTATVIGSGSRLAVRLAGPARGELGVLPSLRGDVRVSLAAARSLLPGELRADFTPGEALVRVEESAATVTLEGTRLLGERLDANADVSWTRDVRASGRVRHPRFAADVAYDGRDLTGENVVADLAVVRRFADVGAVEGEARGRFTLPNLDVDRASADVTVRASRDDARVTGAVTVRSGSVGANLTGDIAGQAFALRGDVLPRASLTFDAAGLRGTLTGDVRREARVAARGRLEGRDVTLNGTLSTSTSSSGVSLNGAVDGATFDVRASDAGGEWRGDGRVNIPSLRAFAEVDGRASATFSGRLTDVRGAVIGDVAGATVTAEVRFDGERVTVTTARAERPDLGALTASGEVYPALNLVGSANVTTALPGRYDVTVGGTFSKPDVRASGRTNGANVDGASITVPNTVLSARLLGQDWRVDARGPSLDAGARGRLDTGLQSARLNGRVDAAWRDGRVTLTGPLTWSSASGWRGTARVSGRAFDSDADVRAVGLGGLTLDGRVADGRVTAVFPSTFPSSPEGRVDLAAFDLGALWGRANELSVTGRADVGGTWQRPTANLSGRLLDARGDLSGTLSGAFADGNVTARLDGAALRGSATLRGGAIEASVEASKVRLARLLPREWNVTRLDLDGAANVTAGGGRDVRVVARNLNVSGEQSDVGAFSVRGGATWTPRRVDADLVANVRGATLTARGSLPSGVRVEAEAFDVEGVGRVSGSAVLTGDLGDPAVSGDVQLVRPEGTALARLFGRASAPRAHVTADLTGDVRGRLFADVKRVSFSPLGVDVRVYGTASSGENRVNVDVAGAWPNLRGEVRATVPALPSDVVARGDGTGRFTFGAGSLLQGEVTLTGFVPTFDLRARITPLELLGASGTGSVTVAGGGTVTNPRLSIAGDFADVERSGVRLGALGVRGSVDTRRYDVVASQGNRDVATLRQETLDVRGLTLSAFGADLVASGRATTRGTADLTVSASGPVSGEAALRFDGQRVTASGRASASGATATFDVAGSEASGWSGTARLTNLPEVLEAGDVPLTIGGAFTRPTVQGRAVLLGTTVSLDASTDGATVRLADGPSTRASGSLRVTPDSVNGDVRIARDGVEVAASIGGPLDAPAATLAASYRGLAARGTLRSTGGVLTVSDGRTEGRVNVSRERIDLDLPGLDLAALDAFGVQGRLAARGSLDLTGAKPTLALDATLSNAERSGARLADAAVRAEGPLDDLAVRASQGGQVVAVLKGRAVTLTNLRASVADFDVTASGRATLDGAADVTLRARGVVDAEAAVKYAEGRVTASGRASASGATATFDVAGSEASGWSGAARVGGLPDALVTREVRLTLSGPFANPVLRGDVGLLGANALLDASITNGLTVRLADGPETRASGALQVRPDKLNGNIRLARDGLDLAATVGGTLDEPTANLDGTFGGWTARGRLGTAGGELTVSDGRREGRAILTRERIDLDLPGLDLASLRVPNVRGTVTGTGTYDLASSRGSFSGRVSGALGDLTIPVLDVPLSGDLDVRATLDGGRVSAEANLASAKGRVSARVTNVAPLEGTVTADLRSGDGTLSGTLALSNAGVNGRVTATAYPLAAAGITARLDANLGVTNDEATLRGTLASDVGRVTIDGSGNARSLLADFAPALGYEARSDGASYRLDARLEGVSLDELDVAPNLRGRVSGTATFADGGATFVLRSTDLESGGTTLPARVEGTLFDDEWRLRGTLGDSQFVGSLTAGVVTGRFTLSALPVSALLEAVSGELPGMGEVTGVARVTAPLSDLPSGRVDVAAERIRVSSGGEVLTGSGSLTYADRELRSVNVQLSGAGAWDVRGRFTRAETNVRASFRGTTFTPVLGLVPTLRDAEPSLRGDLEVLVGGSYDAPTATVTGSNLTGSLAEVAFSVPTLRGSLTAAGAISATANVTTRGLLAANGTVTASGALAGGELTGGRVSYDGDLATQQTGRFERVRADVVQAGRGFTLDATVNQGGVARITGDLLPDTRLTVTARGLTPTLGFIYGRESNVDGTATITSRGDDFVVDGAVTLNRLVIGRVDAPSGVTPPPGQSAPDARPNTFVSPLPLELRTFPTRAEERPQESPLLSRIVFDDIPVRAPNGVRVDENLARAELATNGLVLSGRASAPRISGEVRAVRGNLFLRENEFLVQNGSAVFDGSSAFPRVQLLARGIVPDGARRVTVDVSISGEFVDDAQGEEGLRLDTRFSSPDRRANGAAYGESELYALLAYGTSDIGAVPDAGTLLQSGLRTALNVFVLGEVERNLARALGLDVVRLRTNLLSGESDFRAQLTLGTYLSREFFVQYQVDLTGTTFGQGLLDARYTTPDNRFTFSVSTPIVGLDFSTIRPSLSVAYNLSERESLQFGVRSGPSTTLRLGYSFRF